MTTVTEYSYSCHAIFKFAFNNAFMKKHIALSAIQIFERSQGLSQNLIHWDHSYSIRINRASHIESIRQFFTVISKMGDGPLWWVVGFSLPIIFGDAGWHAFWQMALFAIIAVSSYKIIKHFTSRPRPYISHSEIKLGCPPLDQWSFPSGHTLHAVGFTIMLCHFFPNYGACFIPFALLVAASRVILGLHYVSDVLMGATLAACIASGILSIWG